MTEKGTSLITAALIMCLCSACSTLKPTHGQAPNPLELLARSASFKTVGDREPLPPSEEVVIILEEKKQRGETDHIPLLVEYGLRVHWKCLKQTQLARELPTDSNLALAELVRLAQIAKYTTAHEGGWLDRQFDGYFNRTGWSSYQVYIWVQEHFSGVCDYPNSDRICELIRRIEKSGMSGVGGLGVCHYGCM